MLFSADNRLVGDVQVGRNASFKTTGSRFFMGKFEHCALASTISVVTVLLCVLAMTAENAFAQTSKVLSPEEATGTSLRDFDAIRTLSKDYLDNPDGGDIPLDEDDLWLPDMALARKPEGSSVNTGPRVITYENGRTKTQTLAPAANQSQKNRVAATASPIRQTGHAEPNRKDQSSRVAPSGVATARYDAPAQTVNPIRQTAGFADYQLGEGYIEPNQSAQGFAGYQVAEPTDVPTHDAVNIPANSAETAVVDLPDAFPSATPVLGNERSVANPTIDVNASAQTAPAAQQPFFESIAPASPPLYASTPYVNSGLDELLSNTATDPIGDDPSASNAILGEFPTVDAPSLTEPDDMAFDAPFPETPNLSAFLETPDVEASATAAPYPVALSATATYESGVDLNAPVLVAERPQENVIADANGEPYKPIDLFVEPEEDHVVLNGEDEPFRESYRVTPRPVQKEAIPQREEELWDLETEPLSEAELKELTVADIRISGLEMTAQQFNKIIKTRIGAKFSQQRLEEDKRALLQTKQFVDVVVSTSRTPDRPDEIIVNFDLTPRRMMRYIKVVGNRKISKHDILEELALRPGESRMDPYEVENGRLRIIEFYKSKDYAEPYVEILRGDRPEDVGVVYLIDEGVKQRVLRTKFTGNSIVSSARLNSLISVKPGVFYFIGGTFTRDRLDADVEKLLAYYRHLGYFDARIDREYEESKWFGVLGKDNSWVSVRYIIDEGPRYKIRNFHFNGNRVVSDEELEKQLKVKRGSYYRFDEIEADRIALRYKYQDLGYVRADITPNQIFTDEVGVIDIRYDIEEDHRYRVRDVIVDYVGSESRTMTSVVLNMIDITPGELLNGKKIRMSENTLRQSGYFNDKPSEGQLPEIAVIPDETKSYRLDETGRAEVVRDSSEEKDSQRVGDRPSETTRGQSPDSQTSVYRDQNLRSAAPRAQNAPAAPNYAASYVPYEEAKERAQSRTQLKNASGARTSYLSYGPSDASSATAPPQKSNVAPPQRVVRNGSLVRAQTRQVPSGFSSTTTQAPTVSTGGYQPYDASKKGSQFTDDLDYANGESANLLNAPENYDQYGAYSGSTSSYASGADSAPGFSDGVYGSIGKDILDPVTPDTDEIYDGDVLVKVQEGRTGMFQASIGVNSDYGLVGNVSFTERNFNLFRPPTDLFTLDGWKDAFRGGGQIFSLQASPGTNVQSYRVSWDVPYVFNTKNLFGVTGLYGEHSFDEWFESRYGGEVRVGRQWTPRFSTTLNGGIYNVRIKDPAVGFVPDLNEAVGTNRMYTVGLTAAYDTRNHPYSPSAGYFLKGTGEVGLGDYNFPRVTLDGRYYKTVHKRVDGTGRWVLGLSSHFGWTGDDTPIYERYYGGGSQNLRGFAYREVTPRFQTTNFGVGGNFEFYNTVEFFVPVSGGDEFQVAFFVDSGVVAESLKKWGRYRVAPGFGLRFQIPMLGPAPLALDFAFPVSEDPNDVNEVFTFNVSGSR